MMMNTSKILFLFTMILGTIITISSTNWMGVWMGLELNLISFIPLMFKKKSTKTSEAMMIYFLVQTMGSTVMLMSVVINSWMMITNINMPITGLTLTMISLALKLGAAPFHFWLPLVMNKMEWMNCIILATWQKIAPMTVMSYLSENKPVLMIMAVASTLVGAIGGINQTSLRSIMAYSSISHLGWMMACLTFDNSMWIFYLMVYALTTTLAMLTFKMMSAFYINQFSQNTTLLEKLTYTTVFMSMGGLPPFLGFLPKMMVIQLMTENQEYLMIVIMLVSALITLFYYLRINSTMMLINLTANKWTLNKPISKNFMMMMIFINLMTPMIMIMSN